MNEQLRKKIEEILYRNGVVTTAVMTTTADTTTVTYPLNNSLIDELLALIQSISPKKEDK